jgi:hypothetical protein
LRLTNRLYQLAYKGYRISPVLALHPLEYFDTFGIR